MEEVAVEGDLESFLCSPPPPLLMLLADDFMLFPVPCCGFELSFGCSTRLDFSNVVSMT